MRHWREEDPAVLSLWLTRHNSNEQFSSAFDNCLVLLSTTYWDKYIRSFEVCTGFPKIWEMGKRPMKMHQKFP
jgi:hypothetical protein